MNRRQLLLGMSLAGAIGPLAACGQGSGGVAPQATSTTGTAGLTGASATQQAADMVAAAQKEGKVLVYSTTDSASAKPLLDDFKALYPGVQVEYNDQNSTDMYNKFIAETAAGAETADFMWSSAMDLQVKLVNDGMALTYASPEAAKLPDGTVWQNQAYGTTLEPFSLVFNKRALPPEGMPQNHADFAKLLKDKADVLKAKVTAYDPEKSGTGYLAMTEDLRYFPQFWDIADGLGKNNVQLQTSTGTMIEKVASGENVLGYDSIGSYVLAKAKQDPNVGLISLKDFTVAFSRVAFIAKASKRPNAAKLILDYLLSKRGQDTMAQKSLLYAIRSDAEGEATPSALSKDVNNNLKRVAVGPALLDNLDPGKRLDFFQKWNKALGRG